MMKIDVSTALGKAQEAWVKSEQARDDALAALTDLRNAIDGNSQGGVVINTAAIRAVTEFVQEVEASEISEKIARQEFRQVVELVDLLARVGEPVAA